MEAALEQHVIQAEQLTLRYGRRIGVERFDLTVPPGSIFGFLGPNGAGKTTAIRILMGLLKPQAGHAAIFGHDCWRHSPRIKKDVGYLPGDLRLYPWMTGQSALQLFGRIRGADLCATGHALAEQLQLDMTVRVRSMSTGMRQKLGLVLAIAHQPRLLILDEPSTGLDPIMQKQLHELLRDQRRRGATVFFSSHTLSEVEQLCDRIGMVRRGRIVVDDDLVALRRQALRPVTIVFATPEAAQRATVPEHLELTDRQPPQWQGRWTGPAEPLIQWAAQQRLYDLIIHPPDLQTLFHHHYQEQADAE